MDLLALIGNLFKPASDLIDNIHTSDEEKIKLQTGLMKVQNEVYSKVLEYDTKLLEAQASVVAAEAKGSSWLQTNWRPITMLTFLALVILDCFGILTFRLSTEAFALLKLGIGGYIGGRSIEKVVGILKK